MGGYKKERKGGGTIADKPLYMSKSILAGSALIVYGVYCAVTGTPEDPEVIMMILTGIGVIGLRQAVARSG